MFASHLIAALLFLLSLPLRLCPSSLPHSSALVIGTRTRYFRTGSYYFTLASTAQWRVWASDWTFGQTHGLNDYNGK